jgi:hypothetical protein
MMTPIRRNNARLRDRTRTPVWSIISCLVNHLRRGPAINLYRGLAVPFCRVAPRSGAAFRGSPGRSIAIVSGQRGARPGVDRIARLVWSWIARGGTSPEHSLGPARFSPESESTYAAALNHAKLYTYVRWQANKPNDR